MIPFLYYILIMSVVARAITTPKIRTLGHLIKPGTHQIMDNASRPSSYTFNFNNGMDTRFPQENTTAVDLERIHNHMEKLEYIYVLQSNRYSELVKAELSKHIFYNHEDPFLVMYLKAGGLYSGTGFDDDDFK